MVKTNCSLLLWGITCILFSLIAPLLIEANDFGIMRLAEQSIITGNTGNLIFASVRLVTLNTLRSLPIYTGVLLLAEGLGMFEPGRFRWLRFASLLLIPAIYAAIQVMYHIKYDFGVTAIALIFVIVLVNKMRNMARSVGHKVMVYALLVFGVEWLDIVPMLTPYSIGRGVLSMDIKTIALLNNDVEVLNLIGLSLFVIFIAGAFLIARLLTIYTLEIKAVEKELEFEHLNAQLTLKAMENRSLREMQSLVHDLKTPLTTIQGLAGVITISEDLAVVKKHANYISAMVDKMSNMIDELLRDDSQHIVEVKELVEYAVAHVPQLAQIDDFRLAVADNAVVKVNKIRVSRAIINILENSLAALPAGYGRIQVMVEKQAPYIAITIIDNGQGFIEEHSKDIWQVGFSTKCSSGLGLPFVKAVIEKNCGCVQLENNPEGGAKVVIFLPEVEKNVG